MKLKVAENALVGFVVVKPKPTEYLDRRFQWTDELDKAWVFDTESHAANTMAQVRMEQASDRTMRVGKLTKTVTLEML